MKLLFPLVVLLSLAVAGYALVGYTVLPFGALVGPEMQASFATQRMAVGLHVFASALTLLLGPLQFSRRLRARRPALHRWAGRLYLGAGVLVGGLAGLVLATRAQAGPVAQAGFAALALAWLATGWQAWRAIRGGDVATHRRWMVRNYALSFAAVTLRAWLPAGLASGLPFAAVYPAVAWVCWVPNLLVAEWLLRRRPIAQAVPG